MRTIAQQKNSGMVKFVLVVALLVAAVIAFTQNDSSRRVPGHNVEVVEINPRQVEIRPSMAVVKDGKGESFSSMIKRLKPVSAVNGTYYDKNLKAIGDILVDGKLVNRGYQKHAVAFTKDGRVDFIRRGKSGFKWKGYKSGVAAGPRLIHNGKVAVNPTEDGFSRRASTVKAWRTGIGKTKKGNLLLVVAEEPLTLDAFASIMLDLGAVEAMNLDGGGACGLYHDGKYKVLPMLQMSNILAFYPKRATR